MRTSGFHNLSGDEAGDDNFLSANGKSRKEKRAAKKEAKKQKNIERTGAEISAEVAAAMGMPIVMPPAEKKNIIARGKDKLEKRSADKQFKAALNKGKKDGTLSKVREKVPDEVERGILDSIKAGAMSLFGMETEEEEAPKKKGPDGAKVAMYVVGGLGVLALGAIFFSKGMKQTAKA